MSLTGNRRTAVLGGLALLLVGVTIYDYTRAPDGSGKSEPAATSRARPSQAAPNQGAALAREIAELKYFIAHAAKVRARYEAIAVPYAESVATFATLYAPGEPPGEAAKKRLLELMPAGVKIGDVLVSQPAHGNQGAIWLTATLSFSSGDSAAFEKAILTLGDAANGMLWKELSAAGDAEHKNLRASGQLALLMVENAE
jgi:hypothetical protein